MGSRAEPLPDKLFVEVLFILLASNGILDLRLLKNAASTFESLGDSYALGIAGTGGTSSSSLFPAALCTPLAFGVGNLDEATGCGARGCKEPVDVREVLWLALDQIERPELKDLRLISGVVLEDDGVTEVFLGSIEGDRDDLRVSG
jgi:hypothetical protein